MTLKKNGVQSFMQGSSPRHSSSSGRRSVRKEADVMKNISAFRTEQLFMTSHMDLTLIQFSKLGEHVTKVKGKRLPGEFLTAEYCIINRR